ncbi:Ribonuclease P protein subunit p21 [Gryganskiella cystojenkinii]|nr:Ribonuclease P protein subunit p21 [Gryganskiella cystojenkinii]
MAKKDKKTEGAVQNREIFQRMNFLYQAAMCMATITTQASLEQKQHIADNTIPISTEDSEVGHGSKQGLNTVSEEPAVDDTINRPVEKRLSRARARKQIRETKDRIAMEQISKNPAHHDLTNRKGSRRHNRQQALSGVARFYAATLREIGRKNVIRVGPVIKRSICVRCEAVLIPSTSCEVRIEAEPQLNTLVTCTACGAFRRYFCILGRGIEGDRWETQNVMEQEQTEDSVERVLEEEQVEESNVRDILRT